MLEDGLVEPIDDAKGTSQHIFDEANPIIGPARWCVGVGEKTSAEERGYPWQNHSLPLIGLPLCW